MHLVFPPHSHDFLGPDLGGTWAVPIYIPRIYFQVRTPVPCRLVVAFLVLSAKESTLSRCLGVP